VGAPRERAYTDAVRRHWGFAASFILGVELWVAPAAACIAAPQTFALDSSYPSLEQTVPTNAPLVTWLLSQRPTGSEPEQPLDPRFSVWVDGDSVPQAQAGQRLIGPDSRFWFAWRPAALAPHTTYRYQIYNGSNLLLTSSFVTGDGPAPPMVLEGKLSVSYEIVTVPRMLCNPSLCGPPDCTPDGETEVTKAHVALPRARDGFSDVYASGQLIVALDALGGEQVVYQLLIAPTATNAASAELTLDMPLANTGTTFKPCFLYTVADASGIVVRDTLCQDEPFPAPTLPAPDEPMPDDLMPDESLPHEPVPHEPSATPDLPRATEKRTSQACSMTVPGAAEPYGACTALLALAALIRRRRSKTAL
jgi:hypothetical protein